MLRLNYIMLHPFMADPLRSIQVNSPQGRIYRLEWPVHRLVPGVLGDKLLRHLELPAGPVRYVQLLLRLQERLLALETTLLRGASLCCCSHCFRLLMKDLRSCCWDRWLTRL